MPYLPLPRTFEEYLASRSANMRYHIHRRQKGFAKAAGAELRIVCDADEGKQVLSDFFDLHQRRWRRDGMPGNFQDPAMQEFLRLFCGVAARQGWLRCYVLRAAGQTQGILIAFHWHGTANYYQLGWNPAGPVKSAGVILMAASIKQAIDEGLARYDFLRGDEAYKAKWTAQASEQTTLVIGCRMPARATIIAERIKNKVKTAIEHCFGPQGWERTRRLIQGVRC